MLVLVIKKIEDFISDCIEHLNDYGDYTVLVNKDGVLYHLDSKYYTEEVFGFCIKYTNVTFRLKNRCNTILKSK